MKLKANCKINLNLHILHQREDGYHNLDSVFYPVYGLYDELEVCPIAHAAPHIVFHQKGIIADCDTEKNLVVRCYHRMQTQFPQIGAVEVTLTKHVPFGAGLGGGSSDAAHMAIALNDLFQLGLSQEQLAHQVSVLGADCPFFIYNKACHAQGIGDILSPIDLSLSGQRLILIKPDVAVSTKEAYEGCHPTAPSDVPFALFSGNDFETTVFAKHPLLEEIKKRLLDAGAYYAAMSGSGSTIFGLFQHDAECGANAQLRRLEQEMSSMIVFNDTLA